MSQPASLTRSMLAQLEMELRLMARRGENVLVMAIVPVVVLVFFGSVDVLQVRGARPVDVLVPGCLALAVVATSLVSLGIATAYERSYGVLKRLGGSPLTRAGLIVAKMGAILVVELVQIGLLIAIGWFALDWRPGPSVSVVLLAATVVVGTATFAGLGLLMAGTLRADATLALANALFLVTLLLGGVIVPLEQLPGVLAAVAAVLPGAALSDAFGVALGASVRDALGPLVILLAWSLGSLVVAARTFSWE